MNDMILAFIVILLIALLLTALVGGWTCAFYRIFNALGAGLGIHLDPPRNLVGGNTRFGGCNEASVAELRRYLLEVYDKLRGGCLERDPAVRNKMIDLLTCQALEIACNGGGCDRDPDLRPCGSTNPNDLLAGHDRFRVCFSNCGGPGISLARTVAHELAHVARFHVYGYAAGGDEVEAGRIGIDCG